MRSALRSAWRAALALAVGLALSALLAEAVVLAVFGPQVRFPRHVVGAPWGLRFNEPGAAYGHHSPDVDVHFRINAQGMRAERDVPYAKPPGVRRIVSLGDSFTIGYEVEGDETFSAVLERELRARGIAVEVLNAGVSGFSTAEELLYLRRELWKYAPDLVLVSFYGNDIMDNVRTGLFVLEDGELEPRARRYVPGGWLGDRLNTDPVLAWLSEHSNAFALLKERLNLLLKRRLVRRHMGELEAAEHASGDRGEARADDAPRDLAAALFEALYEETRSHDVPLVVHSIPTQRSDPLRLVDTFPLDRFRPDRPGLVYVPAKEVLDPYVGEELLYWTRSHWHWTPFSHRQAGRALARAILAHGLLERG